MGEEEEEEEKKKMEEPRSSKARYGTLDFCMELTLIMELNGSMEL